MEDKQSFKDIKSLLLKASVKKAPSNLDMQVLKAIQLQKVAKPITAIPPLLSKKQLAFICIIFLTTYLYSGLATTSNTSSLEKIINNFNFLDKLILPFPSILLCVMLSLLLVIIFNALLFSKWEATSNFR